MLTDGNLGNDPDSNNLCNDLWYLFTWPQTKGGKKLK